MIVAALCVLALVAFCCGAANVKAGVNWDALGKAFLVAALVVYLTL
jgi:hypothetical protein